MPRSALILLLAAPLAAQPQTLTLSVTQPCGPGSVELDVTGASAGAELFNLVSLDPYSPTGGGPLYGLNAQGAGILIEQLLYPLGTPPFHVSADGSGHYQYSFCTAPAGTNIPIDVVSLEWDPVQGVVARSNVVYIDLQM